MDPQEALRAAADALRRKLAEPFAEHANSLVTWLARGGFAPTPHGKLEEKLLRELQAHATRIRAEG